MIWDYKSWLNTSPQAVIKYVIFEYQVGYIKGRNITIIRLTADVIEYSSINNATGVIVAFNYFKGLWWYN